MKILQLEVTPNIQIIAILGLPVSGLIGAFFGYLIPIFRRRQPVEEPRPTGNPDLVGTAWEQKATERFDTLREAEDKKNKSDKQDKQDMAMQRKPSD